MARRKKTLQDSKEPAYQAGQKLAAAMEKAFLDAFLGEPEADEPITVNR